MGFAEAVGSTKAGYEPVAVHDNELAGTKNKWRYHWLRFWGKGTAEDLISLFVATKVPCLAFGHNAQKALRAHFWREVLNFALVTFGVFLVFYIAGGALAASCHPRGHHHGDRNRTDAKWAVDPVPVPLPVPAVPHNTLVVSGPRHPSVLLGMPKPNPAEQRAGPLTAAPVTLSVGNAMSINNGPEGSILTLRGLKHDKDRKEGNRWDGELFGKHEGRVRSRDGADDSAVDAQEQGQQVPFIKSAELIELTAAMPQPPKPISWKPSRGEAEADGEGEADDEGEGEGEAERDHRWRPHHRKHEHSEKCEKAFKSLGGVAAVSMLAAWLLMAKYASGRRSQIRAQFGIEGSRRADFLVWLFCGVCALAQETRTIMHNNVSYGVWRGEDTDPEKLQPPPQVAPKQAAMV